MRVALTQLPSGRKGALASTRTSGLTSIARSPFRPNGYSFQQEVYRCRNAGYRIGETPILFENHRAGSFKVNPKEAARSMALILSNGSKTFLGLDRS
jgi:dolichol-phosphate mannosyltransferase